MKLYLPIIRSNKVLNTALNDISGTKFLHVIFIAILVRFEIFFNTFKEILIVYIATAIIAINLYVFCLCFLGHITITKDAKEIKKEMVCIWQIIWLKGRNKVLIIYMVI